MNKAVDDGLGEVLIEKGLITDEQLQEALRVQEKEGLLLKEAVIRSGFATSEMISEMVSEHVNMPYVKLTVDMIDPEAASLIPARVAREFTAIPVTVVANILTIAVSSPFDVFSLDAMTFASGYTLEPILSDEKDILQAIELFFQDDALEIGGLGEEAETIEFFDRDREEGSAARIIDEAPVVRLMNMLLIKAIKEKASDIHLEPTEDGVQVRFRVDGDLYLVKTLPTELKQPLVSRVKIVCDLDITDRRMPQDGRFFGKFGRKDIDFRVATSPTIYGESVTIRILDQANAETKLDDIGFEEGDRKQVEQVLKAPHGFILVTGPTGSGKTTTLYAMLNEILGIERKIITIEDPVEYRLKGITQIPANNKIGLSFASILRSVLRQDPDIILVGEIRDLETAEIAVQGALTGHLLLSTLHTTGAPETLARLVDIGVEPYYIREVVRLIMGQRLVRKLCVQCKESYKPSGGELEETGLDAGGGHGNHDNERFPG
jgi:type IV pilus assembly protein PilB